jgi:hypothetical protein
LLSPRWYIGFNFSLKDLADQDHETRVNTPAFGCRHGAETIGETAGGRTVEKPYLISWTNPSWLNGD